MLSSPANLHVIPAEAGIFPSYQESLRYFFTQRTARKVWSVNAVGSVSG